MTGTPDLTNPVALAYVGAFALAAVACFASIPRLEQIDDRDTQRGLVWLLLTTGGWASTHVGFLVLPTETTKLASYTAGLVLGTAAVGAWLYFASAFTGRTYHRNPTYRRLAVAVFLVIVAVKLTNPIHYQYFETTVVEVPFHHRTVESGALHWTAMAFAYALSFVGYFMLVELFTEIDHDTRSLFALISVTALPVALNVLGFATDLLIDITYEPLGVAVFAVGVAFVHLDEFDTVQLAAERDDPVVAVDSEGNVRDSNRAARMRFPALDDGNGDPLADVLPEIAAHVEENEPVMATDDFGYTQYFHVTETSYGTAKAGLGRTLLFTDVTERERYRLELERQNDRLERFASMISHDLRNPLNVAQGQFDVLKTTLEADDPASLDADTVAAIDASLDRMNDLIEEILTLARTGQTVENPDRVDLHAFAFECWETVATTDATLDLDGNLPFRADPDRLKRLFENLYRNAIEHSTHATTVTVGPLDDANGFYVEDDGPGIPPDDRDDVFDAGYTTNTDGTGFGLAIVKEIATAHNWTITVTDAETGGARFEITNVEIVD